MPEYLAPGVYVEETSFRAKSIEGVGTSTTAFVGPTRKGPYRVDADTPEPCELLTSYGDFERIYGGYEDLVLGGAATTNFLAQAVLAFFNEGGVRLYVSRVVGASPASAAVEVKTGTDEGVHFNARFPGACGNGSIVAREVATPVSAIGMTNAPEGTLLRSGSGNALAFHVKVGSDWRPAADTTQAAADATALAGATPFILTLALQAVDGGGSTLSYDQLGFDRRHPRWVGHVLAALFTGSTVNAAGEPERPWVLAGGADGAEPTDTEYALALQEVAGLEDVAIVAAPGSSAYTAGNTQDPLANSQAIAN